MAVRHNHNTNKWSVVYDGNGLRIKIGEYETREIAEQKYAEFQRTAGPVLAQRMPMVGDRVRIRENGIFGVDRWGTVTKLFKTWCLVKCENYFEGVNYCDLTAADIRRRKVVAVA